MKWKVKVFWKISYLATLSGFSCFWSEVAINFQDTLKITLGVKFWAATQKKMFSKKCDLTTPRREPVVECVHKSVERCHYTYTTQFLPHVQEVCSSFTFHAMYFNFFSMLDTHLLTNFRFLCYRNASQSIIIDRFARRLLWSTAQSA